MTRPYFLSQKSRVSKMKMQTVRSRSFYSHIIEFRTRSFYSHIIEFSQVSHIIQFRQVEGLSSVPCRLGGSFGEEGVTVQRGSSQDVNNGTLSIYVPFSLFLSIPPQLSRRVCVDSDSFEGSCLWLRLTHPFSSTWMTVRPTGKRIVWRDEEERGSR